MKKVHLICNAHLDPVWQWTWQEGIGAALSTFRVAAELTEDFDGFVFNHNEALLYECVENYEPELFDRIKKLVAEGKWNIMGTWYLQPDCNMPTGEAIVRQILVGQTYFREKFGKSCETALNLDSFGHSKGLVQILQLAGYKNYMFMRPDCGWGLLDELPQRFLWEGYAGSSVVGYRTNTGYNTLFGQAARSIEEYIDNLKDQEPGELMRLWGIGDHGGGPSRLDLENIGEMIQRRKSDVEILHSTPDAFFRTLDRETLPHFSRDLNPINVGCYTTMHKIKALHRKLENNLLLAEKSASLSEMAGKRPYPKAELDAAWKELLFCEFHDILPGTSVKPAEEQALQKLRYGIEITDKLLTADLYAFAAEELPSQNGNVPIMVYNPHPYPVTGDFQCEFMLSDQNWNPTFTSGVVYQGDKALPSQMEKENSNINLDWRKKISFHATLEPMKLNRFDCHLISLKKRPFDITDLTAQPEYTFDNGQMQCTFDTSTGSIKRYIIHGKNYAQAGLGELWVYNDNCDPWLLFGKEITDYAGKFRLLDLEESGKFAACKDTRLSPMRIVEDGDVRTVIEVLLGYQDSRAQVLYKLPKHGTNFTVEYNIQWNEKDTMLRANFSHDFAKPAYTGQDMYGTKALSTEYEMVAQKWLCAADQETDRALGVINDCTYGALLDGVSMKPSLLRSAGYTCHPIDGREILPLSRYYPRIDQGEASFRFVVTAGTVSEVERTIDRLAQVENEAPIAVSHFPGGKGESTSGKFTVDGVRMDTCKKSEDGKAYILRLFNPKAAPAEAIIHIGYLGVNYRTMLGGYEIKTLRVENGKVQEAGLTTEEAL